MKEVKVEMLSHKYPEEVEEMIQNYFNEGYTIQDSQVNAYQNVLEGVYVFVRERADE